MGCSNCKKKESFKKQIYESTKNTERGVIWFAVIWFLLGVYGLYSIISKFI